MPFADAHLHIPPGGDAAGLHRALERADIALAFVNSAESAQWPSVLEAGRGTAVLPFIGIHPWFSGAASNQDMARLETLLAENPNAQIGEVGLDRAVETPLEVQEQIFTAQLKLARKLNRAVSVHCVKAWDRVLPLLRDNGPFSRGVILHSFSGPAGHISELAELGAYFSFGTRVLGNQALKLAPLIKAAPKERLLCETDFPHGKIGVQTPEFPPIAEVTAEVGSIAGIDSPAELFYKNAQRIVGA